MWKMLYNILQMKIKMRADGRYESILEQPIPLNNNITKIE